MNLHKIVKIAAAVFGVLGILSLFFILFKGDDYIKEQFASGSTSTVDPIYILGVLLLIAITMIVLIFTVKGILAGNIKRTLITIGMFLGLALLSYIFADSSDIYNVKKELIASGGVSKLVSTGLNMTYFLAIISVGSLFFYMFKNSKK